LTSDFSSPADTPGNAMATTATNAIRVTRFMTVCLQEVVSPGAVDEASIHFYRGLPVTVKKKRTAPAASMSAHARKALTAASPG
jgi:hypothetical protein